jgi:uncharacterized protein YlaI
MRKQKWYKCSECNKKFLTFNGWVRHTEELHAEDIPAGFTTARYFYLLQTGKDHGECIMCKKHTVWNEATFKYARFCNDPICKKKYRDLFKNRMMDMYNGKIHLLDDPDMQKKMLKNRKISGIFTFKDGGKVEYVGSYEKDFLEMLDSFMSFPSGDILGPSPHVYYYMDSSPDYDENTGDIRSVKRMYIPDFYMPALNLEIEIKQNTNKHPKLLAVDKVKELEKDKMMNDLKSAEYIKIVDKDYGAFFNFIVEMKNTTADVAIVS